MIKIDKTIYFKLLLIFAVLFFNVKLFSQNDFESWNNIVINYKVIPKTTLWLSNELRLDNNASGLKKYLVDIGVDRKLTNNFEATLAYRYSRFDDLSAFKNEHLFYASTSYSLKIERFTLSLQTRFQHSVEVFGFSTIRKNEETWRNKFSTNYNIYKSPLSPYISYELFTAVNDPKGFYNDKYRIYVGCKYKMNRRNSFAIYYGIQKALTKSENTYILGLKYSLNLEKEKDKDKEVESE